MVNDTEKGIIATDISEEMQESYLEYAMSVITSRALPDVRDGLKPVQRRILYSMYEMGLRPDKPYKKCAHVVGHTMANYHPHGDSSIYDALVRQTQSFSLRLPVIDGHGNFGSLGKEDPAAAYRYTEARLAPAALPMVEELGEGTVDIKSSYDNQTTEPKVLPAAFPHLLVNGVDGIAVGMATNMAPHNLGEVVAGLRAMLANPGVSLDEMMTHIPGPDMPTGTILIGADGIKSAYATGRGSFRMRAMTKIEDLTARKKGIVVTELPFTVGPEKIIEAIKEEQKAQRLLGVSGVTNLSDRKVGLKLVIEIKTGFNPQAVLEELFRRTKLEESFGVNNVCLVKGQPQTLGLLDLCRYYLDHRIEVTTRRTQHRLDQAEARLHIIEGLLIALQAIDEVVAAIRESRDTDAARKKLMTQFSLSEIQANHILEMPLRRLTSLEVTKLKNEEKQLRTEIAGFRRLLGDAQAMRELVGTELESVAQRFATPRRSRLLAVAPDPGVSSSALEIADEPCTVTLSSTGLISRNAWVDAKPVPFRGKHGRHDGVVSSLTTTTRSVIAAVTERGRLLRLQTIEVPQLEGRNRGGPVREFFVELEHDEKIIALVPVPDPKSEQARDHAGIALATAQGVVKRITFDQFPVKSGQELIGLKDHDRVVGAGVLPSQDADLVFVTGAAQLLRTPASSVRPQGRTGGGVAGMKLTDDAQVIAFGVLDPQDPNKAVLATATNSGSVKVSRLADYPVKGRGTAGVRCHTFRKDEDHLVAVYAGSGTPLAMTDTEPQQMPTELARRDASGTEKFEVAVGTLATARM